MAYTNWEEALEAQIKLGKPEYRQFPGLQRRNGDDGPAQAAWLHIRIVSPKPTRRH